MQIPHSWGNPSLETKAVTPTENLVNGVAPSAVTNEASWSVKTPSLTNWVKEPTTTTPKIANSDYNNIEP